MRIFDDIFLLQRIDQMIRTRATGTPKCLANRLGISECSTYRMIERLKDQGFPIAYDKTTQSYYYQEPVKWQVEFVVGSDKLLSVKGGANEINFFPTLSFFDRASADICNASGKYGAP